MSAVLWKLTRNRSGVSGSNGWWIQPVERGHNATSVHYIAMTFGWQSGFTSGQSKTESPHRIVRVPKLSFIFSMEHG